jgi:glycogen(starch) synthase
MNEAMKLAGTELDDELHFDLIHSHDWLVASAAEGVARRVPRPWIATVHATEYGRHQGWVDKYPQSHIHAAEREMARRADRVITCSRYMRSHVADVFGIRAAKITAMQNGVDPRDLEPVADDLGALRARYAKPDERLVLLVGRLVYEKGFHLALDALAPVIKQLGNVRFVVAGTGTAEAELRRQAWRLGLHRKGVFLGWVGDDMLHSLYRIADMCIVPSIYEPFGIVALEAMASGCLCVVADTGGLREVIPDDGTVGLRFPSRDAAALQEILERVLTDDAERAQLVAEAREHVLRFDWAEVARQTLGVYRRELRAAAPGAEAVTPAADAVSGP